MVGGRNIIFDLSLEVWIWAKICVRTVINWEAARLRSESIARSGDSWLQVVLENSTFETVFDGGEGGVL